MVTVIPTRILHLPVDQVCLGRVPVVCIPLFHVVRNVHHISLSLVIQCLN